MGNHGVYMIVNKQNKKRYVGVSEDIENEWFNIKRDFQFGAGIRKMREDVTVYGIDGFDFQVILETDQPGLLHRKESELAYAYETWLKGYNAIAPLSYATMTEEKLAFEKLRLYKLVENIDDGKYLCMDLIQILGLSKNDLLVLLKEITIDEMRFFKKQIILRNEDQDLSHMYIQIKRFDL